MSKQNKWAGNFGKVASGGSSTKGGNTYNAPKAGSAPRDSSSKSDNVINCETHPGDNMGTDQISSHNDINAFTRGIKSRGPYGGPSFSSFNHYENLSKRSDTSSISSEQKTPSASGGGRSTSRGTAGGSGRGMTSNSKVGSGSVRQTTRQSSPKGSNKDGSGRQPMRTGFQAPRPR